MGADLGFRLFTLQGRGLCRKIGKIVLFKWRPRPPVRLSEQKLKEIKNNLKKTAVRFKREDNEERNRASQEVVEKRRKIMAAFDVIRQKKTSKRLQVKKMAGWLPLGVASLRTLCFPAFFG